MHSNTEPMNMQGDTDCGADKANRIVQNNENDSGESKYKENDMTKEEYTDKDGRERDKPHREPVSFPSRLFDVLQEENPSIIQWKDRGTSFHITDVTCFIRDILFNRFKCTYVQTFRSKNSQSTITHPHAQECAI